MPRRIVIALLLVHTIVTYVVMKSDGYWSVFPPYKEFYVNQIFSDLVVALTLVHLFIFLDLRKRSKSTKVVALSLFGSFFLGSISPLLLLLRDKEILGE